MRKSTNGDRLNNTSMDGTLEPLGTLGPLQQAQHYEFAPMQLPPAPVNIVRRPTGVWQPPANIGQIAPSTPPPSLAIPEAMPQTEEQMMAQYWRNYHPANLEPFLFYYRQFGQPGRSMSAPASSASTWSQLTAGQSLSYPMPAPAS